MKIKICAIVFLRSLLINAAWNYQRMQNIGFAYSLAPLADRSAETKREMLLRHTDTFSTHPYMATLIIGSIARLETAGHREHHEVIRQKQALMGPFAAIGDPFFWGSLKPASAIVAVLLALSGCMFAPVLFLLLFNSVHLWIRIEGFAEGCRFGAGALDFLKKIELPVKTKRIKWCSLALLVLVAGVFFEFWQPLCSIYPGVVKGLVLLAIIMVSLFLRTRRVSSLAILYGISILFFLIEL
jgi:PTS system mannose-specific IID component